VSRKTNYKYKYPHHGFCFCIICQSHCVDTNIFPWQPVLVPSLWENNAELEPRTHSSATHLGEVSQYFRHLVSSLSAAHVDDDLAVGVLGQRLGDDRLAAAEGSRDGRGPALHTPGAGNGPQTTTDDHMCKRGPTYMNQEVMWRGQLKSFTTGYTIFKRYTILTILTFSLYICILNRHVWCVTGKLFPFKWFLLLTVSAL